MIFKPRGVIGVLVEIAVRDVLMLSGDHAAQAAKIAFHHVGMLAMAVAVAFRMVDAGRGGDEMARKDDPQTVEYEAMAKNLLKAELKRKGVTYAHLAEKLAAMDIHETERNLNNKISRGVFSAAFLLQCLSAIGAHELRLS